MTQPSFSDDEEKFINLFSEALKRNDQRREQAFAEAEAAKQQQDKDKGKDTTPKTESLATRLIKGLV